MIVLKLTLLTLFISLVHCRIPDKVYCATEQCDRPISKAKTLLSYTSPDPDLISYRANSEALVFMKTADTNSELWYVSVNGKSGFANPKFLREQKILEKNSLIIVPYNGKNEDYIVQPDKVQHPHEVIEGTTIYTTETAVNNEQASTISPPVIPSDLSHATETFNQNVDKNTLNVPSYDSNEVRDSQSSDGPVTSQVELETEIQENIVEKQREPLLNAPNLLNEPSLNSDEHSEPSNQEVDQMLPKELPSDSVGQQLLESSSTLNTEPIVEVPEGDLNKEQTNNEQNTSTLSNNVDNVPPNQEHSETIVPNMNIYPNVPAMEPSSNNYLENQDSVTNINGVPFNDNTHLPEPEPTQSPTIQPDLQQSTDQSVPPIEIPVSTTEPPSQLEPLEMPNDEQQPQNVPNIVPNEASATLPEQNTLDSIVPFETTTPAAPDIAVPIEVIVSNEPPPVSAEVPIINAVPTTTETIPPLFSQEYQALPTQETLAPIMADSPPLVSPPQNLPPLFEYTTASSVVDELNQYTSSESTTTAPTEDAYTSVVDNEPYSTMSEEISTSTESIPQEENTASFLSNVYSTVADMWPSTTETPSIYNTEEYPTYESEKTNMEEGFSFWKYLMSKYYSVFGTTEESKALFAAVGETCFTDEYCDGTSNDGNNRLLTFLLTTSCSVLLFTLGYYYIDNKRQDGRLIGTINSLQRDLLFSTKECEILKEELATTKNKLAGIEDSSFGMDDMVQSLKEEIAELKATNDRLRNSLDDNEKLLRVSENTAGELQNTLSEVENTLSELLAERANSEEQILELNGKIQAFEEELISVSRDRDNFQLKYVSAETALEEFKKQKKQLDEFNQLLSDANNTIELQKHEIVALKDAIKDLKSGMPSNVDVTSLIDHTEIKAKLAKAEKERNSLAIKYETEHKERARLAEELKMNQESLQTANQSATEALTRLEVLGKYFQEREGELLKELSAKESLYLSKQGESASTVEKIELLQQEAQRYKEKCDALTLELAEQESVRRAALGAAEARAHGAWLEARAARRDADAARDDAAALRRKLAALSAHADGAVSPHHKVSSPLENVENPVIPPPLPPMFLPPPLLPPLPRPPPLGRLPSPHPPRYGERRYSPDSRYSPQSRYSPDSRYSPETVRYSPESRYSPRRRSPYSPRSRRRSRSRERYTDGRGSRSRNGPGDTETEYNSDSPTRQPRRRRYSRNSGPSSGSGCSSESDK